MLSSRESKWRHGLGGQHTIARRLAWASAGLVGLVLVGPIRGEQPKESAQILETFVSRQLSSTAPTRYRKEWLPLLRWGAFREWNRTEIARNTAWVLVWHEWQSYQRANSRLARRAAAWRLTTAADRHRSLSLEKGVTLTPKVINQLALVVSYRRAVSPEDRPVDAADRATLRELAREQLGILIRPSSTDKANLILLGAIRRAFVQADEGMVTAIVAREQALYALRKVYGDPRLWDKDGIDAAQLRKTPEKLLSQKSAHDHLSENERKALYDENTYQSVRPMLLSSLEGQSEVKGVSTLVQEYGCLRALMGFERDENAISMRIRKDTHGVVCGLSPPSLERWFQNNHRDRIIRKRLSSIGRGITEKEADASTLKKARSLDPEALSKQIEEFVESIRENTFAESAEYYSAMGLLALLSQKGDDSFLEGTYSPSSVSGQIRGMFLPLSDRLGDEVPEAWRDRFGLLAGALKHVELPSTTSLSPFDSLHTHFLKDLRAALKDPLGGQLLNHLKQHKNPDLRLFLDPDQKPVPGHAPSTQPAPTSAPAPVIAARANGPTMANEGPSKGSGSGLGNVAARDKKEKQITTQKIATGKESREKAIAESEEDSDTTLEARRRVIRVKPLASETVDLNNQDLLV